MSTITIDSESSATDPIVDTEEETSTSTLDSDEGKFSFSYFQSEI